ncbi:hypothetical protein LTR84_005922 [Exophiala bonariae]|uniref:Transcription factor domain-containing protein n=1 Tax=Exophiala bonariae TaxID=1690606 RepID=A0AAV9N347_9EURO|nr:hypothetical protein LTR84_005922 [Exophiala bonariae]
MQSDFNSSVFRAEALGRPSPANERPADLRHKNALSERIRNASQNDMLMVSTLAYASGAIGWRYGVCHEELPPEYLIQQTYRSIRKHLQQSGEVEEKLLWSIYGLAAAEMWVLNFDAAATHMRAIQVLISQLGGITKLTPLFLESIILGGKFLAIFTMAAPIPLADFEPDGLPEGWPPQSIFSTALPPELRNLGTSFFAAGDLSALDDWYRDILVDLVACVQISHYVSGRPNQSLELVHERWLYLKVQALNYRLLARTELIGMQEAVRIATLLWVLSITDYVGAGLTALFLLPKLQAALKTAQFKEPSSSRSLPGLYFWMSSLGALVALSAAKQILISSSSPRDALYSQQFNFFSLHAAQTAHLIGLETKSDVYRTFLQTYLYLDVNGGPGGDDLKYLVETVSRIDQDSLLGIHTVEYTHI